MVTDTAFATISGSSSVSSAAASATTSAASTGTSTGAVVGGVAAAVVGVIALIAAIAFFLVSHSLYYPHPHSSHTNPLFFLFFTFLEEMPQEG